MFGHNCHYFLEMDDLGLLGVLHEYEHGVDAQSHHCFFLAGQLIVGGCELWKFTEYMKQIHLHLENVVELTF